MSIATLTPSAGESKIPSRVEVDENGVAWTIPPQGGRLKRTNDHGAHRPKKEVREKWLRIADKDAIAWANRVLANEKIPDNAPEKLKAIELSLAYGLGKQDEVIKLGSEEFIGHATDVLASFNGRVIDLDLTREFLTKLHAVMGLKE